MIHNKPRNYLLHLNEKGNKLYENQRVKNQLTRSFSLEYQQLRTKISAHCAPFPQAEI